MDIHEKTNLLRRIARLEEYVFGETNEQIEDREHRELVAEFEADLKLRTLRFAALAEALDKEDG